MDHSAHLDHARHDPTLIAGHAAGDLSSSDVAAAADLVSTCTSCAELHRDLLALSVATRALPRVARAPRDFRITADQAARLHHRTWVGSLLRPFASAHSVTRPLAAAFTSVGVAGLLVAMFVPGLLGGAASAPARESTQSAAMAASEAPKAAPGAAGAPSGDGNVVNVAGDSGRYVAVGAGASPDSAGIKAAAEDSTTDLELQSTPSSPAVTNVNLLQAGSIGLLLVGLAMFGLRLAARSLR